VSGQTATITVNGRTGLAGPVLPQVAVIQRADSDPTSAAALHWTVAFNTSVTGVDLPDFTLSESGVTGTPALTSVTGSGNTYTVAATSGGGSGTIGLNLVDNDTIVEIGTGTPIGGVGAGNGDLTGDVYTLDRTPPVVTAMPAADANPSSALTVSWSVAFSEAVEGVDAADFTLVPTGVSGASVLSVTGDGSTYTVVVSTGTGQGTLGLKLTDDDTITDFALNPLGGAGAGNGTFTGAVYTIDRSPVVQSITRVDPNPTTAASVRWTVTFSESVTGVDVADFAVAATGASGASVTSVSGSGTTYIVTTTTGATAGTLGLNLADNDSIVDGTGNRLGGTGAGNGDFVGETYTVVKPPLVVVSINAAGPSPTNAASVSWVVTFSEPATGVGKADFAVAQGPGLSGTSVTTVTGSGATYTVTASSGSGAGTLGLNLIDDDSIRDTSGNRLGGTGVGNGNFVGAVYTIDRTGPTVVSVTDTDQDGVIEVGDTLVVTLSEPIDPASVNVTQLTVSRAKKNDFFNIPGLTNAAVDTGTTGYLKNIDNITATYAASAALSGGNAVVTVTIGGCTANCANAGTGAGIGGFTFAPAASIKDTVGNAATGTFAVTSRKLF
jgi:hypothetical protein